MIGPKRQDILLQPEDLMLVETIAPMLTTALQRAQLMEQLHDQLGILDQRQREVAALNVRLLEVQDMEREQIALDIHDDPLQRAILLSRTLAEAGDLSKVGKWKREADELITSLRAVCAGLAPTNLRDFGLPAGLEWLLTDARVRSDLEATLEVRVASGAAFGRLDPTLELALYRVAQEALNNCLRHAEAKSVSILLRKGVKHLTLNVEDDGKGFEVTTEERAPLHLGILSMGERLRPWQGLVRIRRREEGGTRVSARVPIGGADG